MERHLGYCFAAIAIDKTFVMEKIGVKWNSKLVELMEVVILGDHDRNRELHWHLAAALKAKG
jgi:hypothetical protein